MIVNDLNRKVKDKFYKEIEIEDNGEGVAYVFPDTKEFISVLKRKLIKDNFISIDKDD
jgi:hypothetical protein